MEYPPSHDRRHTVNVVLQAPGPLHSEMGVRWGFGSPLPYTAIVGQWDHRRYRLADNSSGAADRVDRRTAERRALPELLAHGRGFHWHAHRWGILWQPYFEVVNLYDRRNVFTYFIDAERAAGEDVRRSTSSRSWRRSAWSSPGERRAVLPFAALAADRPPPGAPSRSRSPHPPANPR